MKTLNVLASILLLLVASAAFAAGPNLLSYQGQVLTAGGAPVANGIYPAKFEFFTTAVAGSSLWSETGTIATTAGLFTHTLGSITAIPTSVFTGNPGVWLEVTVNGQMQAPRTQLTSAGNSIATGTVDRATGGTILSSIGVGEAMVTTGSVAVYSNAAPFATGSFYDQPGFGAGVQLWDEVGNLTGVLEPDFTGSGGFFGVVNGLGGAGFFVDGNATGGSPFVTMNGFSSVSFDLSTIANNSVQLPADAIASPEILDEPGVASNYTLTGITPFIGVMTDLVTVTITIPAPGYISLFGKTAGVDLCNTTGSNWVFAQIDETAGGTYTAPHYTVFGATSFPTAGCSWGALDCQRIYFKGSAGSYTFRLEAQQGSASPGSTSIVYYPTLTATYFPTSYGTVVTAASSAEAGSFESAVSVNSSGFTPGTGAVATDIVTVDLRELELKAAKLEVEAQKARTALAEARLKEQLNAKPTPNEDKK
jgi:hypothetical protein